MRVSFTLRAQQDLEDLFDYGASHFGLAAAESYAAGITKATQLIASQPHIERLRNEFAPPIRIHHWRNHYLIYMVEPSRILILRVLHHSSDVAWHLKTDRE